MLSPRISVLGLNRSFQGIALWKFALFWVACNQSFLLWGLQHIWWELNKFKTNMMWEFCRVCNQKKCMYDDQKSAEGMPVQVFYCMLSSGRRSPTWQVCTRKLIPELQRPPLLHWKLSRLAFTHYTLGALIWHVVNILMVYNDSVFTVLIQSNHPRVILF